MKIKHQIILIIASISIVLFVNTAITNFIFKSQENILKSINTLDFLLKYFDDFNYIRIDFENKRTEYYSNPNNSSISELKLLKKQQLYILEKIDSIIRTSDFDSKLRIIILPILDSIRRNQYHIDIGDSTLAQCFESQKFFNQKYNGEFNGIENNIRNLQAELKQKSKNNIKNLVYYDIAESLLIVLFTALIIKILIYDNRKLKVLIEELKVTNQTKDKFFSIISHDLRSPFNSILGFTELLQKNIEKYPIEKIKKYIEHIYSSSRKTYKLLENLLEWSRLQLGKITPNYVLFNLYQITTEVVELMKNTATAKSIQLSSEMPPDITMVADIEMIKTILRNLISNSIKFTNTNGFVTIKATKNLNNLIITVEDNGVGMEKNIVDKLFKIDANISTAGTQGESGTGLGLLLCNELVEINKGKIEVESQCGKGTIFTLRFKIN